LTINYLKMPENRVVITVAQTGALVTKKMNPSVPEQPDEIAQSALDCYNEGAAVVHIHARDKNNVNSG
jgi:3-keto-5-aminohexanoate cleavage enzyme